MIDGDTPYLEPDRGQGVTSLLVAGDFNDAESMTSGVRELLEMNSRLHGDFPEACFPIHSVAGINARVKSQTCDGLPTNMELTDTRITLPTILFSEASGNTILAYNIHGGFKGLHVRHAGCVVRPDLVFIDNAYTRETLQSVTQAASVEAQINEITRAFPDAGIARFQQGGR